MEWILEQIEKHHRIQQLLARWHKDETSCQESLVESCRKQTKLPTDNVKAKGITEKSLTDRYQWWEMALCLNVYIIVIVFLFSDMNFTC